MRGHVARILVVLLPLVLPIVFPVPAGASIPGLALGPPETVDTGVPAVPMNSGPSAAFTPDWLTGWPPEWHVVYEKDGDIYHAVRGVDGWHTPERIVSGQSLSQNPKLTFDDANLHVVWEDDRSGHTEIWTKRFNGSTWSEEECLTENAFNSRHPSIIGTDRGVVVAWQEESGLSFEIQERGWFSHWWQPTIVVSEGVYSSSNPTLCLSTGTIDQSHFVYWLDTRYGFPEIMTCGVEYGIPQRQDRMTDMTGACAFPSATTLEHDGFPASLAAFEADENGTAETWIVTYDHYGPYITTTRISPPGGVASVQPGVAGLQYGAEGGGQWMEMRFFVTYTDMEAPGSRVHHLIYLPDGAIGGEEVLSTAGVSYSTIASYHGNPDSEILTLYVENREGASTLVSRRGTMRTCFDPTYSVPTKIILAPEGIPPNLVSIRDACEGGGGLARIQVDLLFDGDLESQLTWDVYQQHPWIPAKITDQNGEAWFRIRGGGCSDAGYVFYYVEMDHFGRTGARSPDVNGDCVVGDDDLQYVLERIGGTDPCADIDGSGRVDEADLAIVQATLGDRCNQVSGVDGAGAIPDFRVAPNPCRERVGFYLKGGAAGVIRIVDVGGRLVRDFGMVDGRDGLIWDLRNGQGRPVAPGIYFAILKTPEQERRRTVLVVR